MRSTFFTFLFFCTMVLFVAAHGGGGHGGAPQPSQTPTAPGGDYDCPDKDSNGNACTGKENLGDGHIKCHYGRDTHCSYNLSSGECSRDQNYNKCSSQAKPGHHKRSAARAPRPLKQHKMKRVEKSRLAL